MPLYEFECADCGENVELILKVRARPPKCEECGGKLAKRVSAPAFQFKGSGWYVTDYAGKKSDGAKSDDAGASKGEKGSSAGGNGGEKASDSAPEASEKKPKDSKKTSKKAD